MSDTVNEVSDELLFRSKKLLLPIREESKSNIDMFKEAKAHPANDRAVIGLDGLAINVIEERLVQFDPVMKAPDE